MEAEPEAVKEILHSTLQGLSVREFAGRLFRLSTAPSVHDN